MRQVRDRKLTDAEKPVGMAGPFHVQVVAKRKRQGGSSALELIHDGAVVDAADGDAACTLAVEQLPALALDFGDAHGPDAAHALGEDEIGQCLLFLGADLHQHDMFRFLVAEDGAANHRVV